MLIKIFKLLMIFIFCFAMPLITNAESRLTIGYIGYSSEKPFWVKLGNAVKEEASNRNIDLIDFTPSDIESDLQVKLIMHAIKKRVNGIIIGSSNSPALSEALSLAYKNKIPVIAVDTMIEHPAIISFVATDNQKGAAIAGQYIVEKTNGNGTVLILGGTKDHENGDARRYGVENKAKSAGMKVLFRRANWMDELAYKFASDELKKENDISAIFSCWDPGIDTASHVIEKLKIDRDILLVGFDGLPRTLGYIKKGKVNATIAQNPEMMGKKSVENLFLFLNGKEYSKRTLIPPFLVDKDRLIN